MLPNQKSYRSPTKEDEEEERLDKSVSNSHSMPRNYKRQNVEVKSRESLSNYQDFINVDDQQNQGYQEYPVYSVDNIDMSHDNINVQQNHQNRAFLSVDKRNESNKIKSFNSQQVDPSAI